MAVMADYKAGMLTKHIAYKHGVSYSYAAQTALYLGLPPRTRRRHLPSEALKQRIVEDYLKGKKVKDIMRKFGVGNKFIYLLLKRGNLKPNRRGQEEE